MTPALQTEIADMLRAGCERVTVGELRARFQALGYRLGDPCDGTSTNMTTGNRYPERVYDPIQQDGKSAFHSEARRDENFKAMQHLRGAIFAVWNGRMVTV